VLADFLLELVLTDMSIHNNDIFRELARAIDLQISKIENDNVFYSILTCHNTGHPCQIVLTMYRYVKHLWAIFILLALGSCELSASELARHMVENGNKRFAICA
jgi:hypothetical protein